MLLRLLFDGCVLKGIRSVRMTIQSYETLYLLWLDLGCFAEMIVVETFGDVGYSVGKDDHVVGNIFVTDLSFILFR
ncbi:hypothetical protein HanRHA438_Chr02g0052751 [Helianthus annuus]|nr:hypothetical protein HanRHA438_Chr02g0052751 [Helianthus annuus]